MVYLSTINIANSMGAVNKITGVFTRLRCEILTKNPNMKNLIKLFSILFSIGFFLSSCEGPMGPTGEPGKDGTNGIDANATCTLCHSSSAVIETKLAQWGNSVHATGENAAYANRNGCLQCHTSQGFLQAVATGSTSNLTIPTDPMQINCYTCHKIHQTFTDEDWALTKPGAEQLIVKYAGATITYDKGNSNQCVQCHQARDVSPAPVLDGPDFVITSSGSRMGVHHAPMANFLLGKIPFDVLPGEALPTTANDHAGPDGCITCHMSVPYGYMAGGHEMGMTYSAHEGPATLNTTGCLTCHTTSTSATMITRFTTLQTSIQAKLDQLKDQLIAYGVYDTSNDLAKPGTWKANAVLAYLNYDAVVQDKSLGIHNPAYITVLLDNSIAAMTAILPPVK